MNPFNKYLWKTFRIPDDGTAEAVIIAFLFVGAIELAVHFIKH